MRLLESLLVLVVLTLNTSTGVYCPAKLRCKDAKLSVLFSLEVPLLKSPEKTPVESGRWMRMRKAPLLAPSTGKMVACADNAKHVSLLVVAAQAATPQARPDIRVAAALE